MDRLSKEDTLTYLEDNGHCLFQSFAQGRANTKWQNLRGKEERTMYNHSLSVDVLNSTTIKLQFYAGILFTLIMLVMCK